MLIFHIEVKMIDCVKRSQLRMFGDPQDDPRAYLGLLVLVVALRADRIGDPMIQRMGARI